MAEPPPGWYPGADPTGTVHVRLDADAGEVRLALDAGWRAQVGVTGLSSAVHEAFTAAVTARLTAWSAAPARPAPAAVANARPAAPARDPAAALVRAHRDLREFRVRLTALHRTPQTLTSPCGRVRVTVLAGQVGPVELDPPWVGAARDTELAVRIEYVLRAALRITDELTARALDGCPDLRELLATAGPGPGARR